MLVSSFAASGLVTVQASPDFPWEAGDGVTLYATETTNPYWGYYGGYHDIWQAIKTELAKIGINLVISYFDDFSWYDRVATAGHWNYSHEDGGWDMYIQEWWLQPHALEPWFSSMVYSWLQPDTPEQGFNSHPWNNSKADELLERGMTSFDAETRKYYLDKWQEVFMHDAPWINIYYPQVYETIGAWLDGYEPSGLWFYDLSHLSLDTNLMPDARKALHQDWVYYAVSEDVWNLLPTFMDTYTEEQLCTIQWSTLYKWSMDWTGFVTGTVPDPSKFEIIPYLAASDPVPVGGNPLQMRVNLRQGVQWSDGNLFDADDVVMTVMNFTIPKQAGNTGIGDVVWWCENVTKVDQYTVDFYLKRQTADFKSLLANDWGMSILPHHIFKDVPIVQLKNHESTSTFDDPSKWAPVTGPFKLKEIIAGEYALLERNDLYFGFNASVMAPDPTHGPDTTVQAIYLKTVPDPAVRLLEFQTYRLDLGEYPTAPVEVWKEMEKDNNLNVFQYDYPASNPIWINFDNEYLSNRWIRLAIAHAVPYEKIFAEILPSWGVETAYPGKTYVMPVQYYTEPNTGGDLTGSTVHLFNEELEAWSYDIGKALDYMYLWWNSENTPGTADGAVGDSDLSGLVDLDDYLIFRANTESGGDTWPQTVVPGNTIDPDFNDDNDVELDPDFLLWASHYGVEY